MSTGSRRAAIAPIVKSAQASWPRSPCSRANRRARPPGRPPRPCGRRSRTPRPARPRAILAEHEPGGLDLSNPVLQEREALVGTPRQGIGAAQRRRRPRDQMASPACRPTSSARSSAGIAVSARPEAELEPAALPLGVDDAERVTEPLGDRHHVLDPRPRGRGLPELAETPAPATLGCRPSQTLRHRSSAADRSSEKNSTASVSGSMARR